MLLSFDNTGFPLVFVPEKALEVHVLPVTKEQFERFLEETGAVDDAAYGTMLEGNPRVGSEELTERNREGLFATGALPEEALAFAGWLGEGFRLPTVEEWRAIYLELALSNLAAEVVGRSLAREAGPPRGPTDSSRELLRALLEQEGPCSLFQFMLLDEGLVEWVRHDDRWVGMGRPRPAFQPNLWNPLENEVVPLREGERLRYFGFRLVRRGGWTGNATGAPKGVE